MNRDALVFDVLVIGAGPGGIAAAVTAAEAGQRVGLVDEAPFAGGQIWRNLGGATVPRGARKWLERLKRCDGVTWLRQSRVVARPSAKVLLIETPTGPRHIRWHKLILATGSRELFLPFPGWTLPGVVGAGGIQALVKQGLPVAGKRVVVAGTGPLLLAVADLLKCKGATVDLILEQAPASRINAFAVSLWRSPSKLLTGAWLRGRLLGTKYATSSYPLRVTQATGGLRVQYQSGETTNSIDCDYLACGFNLIPNSELPQLLNCDVTLDGFARVDDHCRTLTDDVYAIGELTAIGGVDKAILEGRIAGHSAAGQSMSANALLKARQRWLTFAARMAHAFSLRPELVNLADKSTIVCRCEDVTAQAIERCIDARDAKLQTRCGMGPCQGRICGPIVQLLYHFESPVMRPPIVATTIGTLASRDSNSNA